MTGGQYHAEVGGAKVGDRWTFVAAAVDQSWMITWSYPSEMTAEQMESFAEAVAASAHLYVAAAQAAQPAPSPDEEAAVVRAKEALND